MPDASVSCRNPISTIVVAIQKNLFQIADIIKIPKTKNRIPDAPIYFTCMPVAGYDYWHPEGTG
jgi:hypothetical protein